MTNNEQPAPIWFTVPEELHHIDLNEPPEERIKRSYGNVVATLGDSSTTEHLNVVHAQEIMISEMIHQGAIYLGTCLARSEKTPSKITTGQYSILVQNSALPKQRPMATLADGLKRTDGLREVAFADFPSGEAVVTGEEVEFQTTTSIDGTPRENTHRVRQAQIILPFPTKDRIAITSVSTEHLEDWEHYISVLESIANSISFTDPNRVSIGDRLAGL